MAARGALEAMLTVTGQQEFAAAMKAAMGSINELVVATDLASKNMLAAGERMDAAFGAQRVAGIRAMNNELRMTGGHLRGIVSMLGGPGVIGGFGLYEAIKIASKQATNAMQWQSEAGVSAALVPGLNRVANQQAGRGINAVDAGQIIRMVESAYGGTVTGSNPLMQSYFTNSSNLQAISGGRVSALDAASLLIPLLQADKTLAANPTRAAALINAMVGTGNMQTQDAMAILKTPTVGALAGFGISASDLAPFFAFGADTRGGQQAAPFGRLLMTSFMNLAKGGANKTGKADLANLLPGQNLITDLQAPNGSVNTIEALGNALIKQYGSLTAPGAVEAIMNIFGGVRGGSSPLSIYANMGLFKQKVSQYGTLSGSDYYNQATDLAQNNPQQQWLKAKAQLNNALGDLGRAALPIALKVLPPMTEMFKLMGNPNVLHFVELMLGLRGLSMLSGGVGALVARDAAGGLMGAGMLAKFNPVAAFRTGLAGRAAAGAGIGIAEEVGGGAAVGAAAIAAVPLAVLVTAAGAVAAGVWAMNYLQRNDPTRNNVSLLTQHQIASVANSLALPASMGNRTGAGSVARSQVPRAAYPMLADMGPNSPGLPVNTSDSSILAWAQATGIFPQSMPGTSGLLLPRTSDITNSIRSKYAQANGMTFTPGKGFAGNGNIVQHIYPSQGMNEQQLANMVAEATKKAKARS